MRLYLFSLFIFLNFVPKAFAELDRPLFKNFQFLEDSAVVEDEKIKLNCYVYRKYVVLEKEEPGFLGKNIYYKEIAAGNKMAPETHCKNVNTSSFKKLDSSGASYYGIHRRFLFVQDPDELSARTKFEIYNLESGLMTYSGIKNNDTILKIIPISSRAAALEYYQRYVVDCDFSSEKINLKCWVDFLGSIEVPEEVKIPYPKCPKSKNPKKYQVFLKVQVRNIQKTKRTFLWSKPICEIAP